MRPVIIVSLLLLAPQLAGAAETAGAEGLLVPALKMLGALALVIGLLLLFYAASRKGFGILPRTREGRIRMLETRALGGKKYLCLVRVRDRELLLGVSNERIECLTRFDTAADDFAATLERVEAPTGPEATP